MRPRSELAHADRASLDVDPAIADVLAPGERVIAVRRSVDLQATGEWGRIAPDGRIDLYVTDRRVLGIGVCLDLELADIGEADANGNGVVLLRVGEMEAVVIAVSDPALLRAEIGVARRDLRAGRRPQPISR